MDLKDVVQSIKDKADEANTAFHAGHPEKSNLYFKNIMEEIRSYFAAMSPTEVAALEAFTSEKPTDSLMETQEKVSAPGVHPAVIDPKPGAQQAAFDKAGP